MAVLPPGGTYGYSDMMTVLNNILTDLQTLRTEVLALRDDFVKHDHGDTGSYAQAGITKRGSAATVTGTLSSTGTISLEHSTMSSPVS